MTTHNVPPPAPPMPRLRRRRRWPIPVAWVVALLLVAVVVVWQRGGFERAPYRSVETGAWVTTGQFRIKVLGVRWADAGIKFGPNKGAHKIEVTTEVENIGDQPVIPAGDGFLGFRMDGRQWPAEESGDSFDAAHPHDGSRLAEQYLAPGQAVRHSVWGNVPLKKRSTPPGYVDVLLLGTERTLGDDPSSYYAQWEWRPTHEIVATVRTQVRT